MEPLPAIITKLPRTNKGRIIGGIGVLVVVIIAIVLIFSLHSHPPIKVVGSVKLISGRWHASDLSDLLGEVNLSETTNEPCVAKSSYADIKEDAPLTATDGNGKILAIARLGTGLTDNYQDNPDGDWHCTFGFAFDELPYSKVYNFQVGNIRLSSYSIQDIESQNYQIVLKP